MGASTVEGEEPLRPTVGRIVNYVSHPTPEGDPSRNEAAVITAVNEDDTLLLTVFTPGGVLLKDNVIADQDDDTAGTWHWPRRCEE